MITSFAIISLLTGAAFSQSIIPSGISDKCSTFLKALNDDKAMEPCTSALISATSAYAPGANTTSSSSSISTALEKLCSSTTCQPSLLRTQLAKFTSECNEELTTKVNNDVLRMYDTLYLLTPVRNVLCTKDDEAKWCLMGISGNVENAADLEKNLSVESGQVTIPNAALYCSSNLPFAFLKPSLPADKLCKPCTRQILTSYISFESETPYAPGLSKSALLCGQTALYDGVVSTCGQDFLNGAVQAAGGISSGVGSENNAAPRAAGFGLSSAAAIIIGVASMALLH